ncbi:MAG: asparagine synthase (glutamine-hydrolyzing) [Maritimibacter sp.]|nr:asparagine synthase (glutamine-hydrolyzing) [Maritimibacter sp.]
MCGIAGFLSDHPEAVQRARVSAMTATLEHRGPDGHGFHTEPGCAFGHARLSIIDLAGGTQPMSNEDDSVTLTFNGEIFNFIEIRDDLIARGVSFRTKSDTEVILRLYETYGEDCVDHLNGDFAFGLWDRRQQKLLLARDRMGVRPLFYTQARDGFYFASEVKALLAVPGIEAELDPFALDQIFTLWFPLAPRTPFKNVSELPPGHVLVADAKGIRTRAYWRLDYPDFDDRAALDLRASSEVAETLAELLTDATRIRLRSDVPVGAYLSGGLDSSIITAAINQIAPTQLRTFSVGFEDDEFDETAFQQQMVKALGTDHEATSVTRAMIGEMFPDVVRHTERPILRTAPAPLYALSKLVRSRDYKVVLTGEGADEVFAGYDIFKEAKLRRFCARQPGSQVRPLLFKRLYPYLPGLQNQSQAYLEAFFNVGLGSLDDPLYSHLPRFRTTGGAKVFFSSELKAELKGYDALEELRDSLPKEFTRWHPLSQAQYLEAGLLLPGYILSSQGDRMSMANSVEGRFPFLDHRLVEFAATIPPEQKILGLREKHILRQAMADLLPPEIGNRPKQPYRAPDSPSFTGPAAPAYVDDVLSPQALEATGHFNPRAVGQLRAKCATGKPLGFRDNMAFVGILSTQLWSKSFTSAGRQTQPQEKIA